MSTKLTDIAIQNLKPGDTRREVPDPGCAGLYLVVQPSGSEVVCRSLSLRRPAAQADVAGGLSLAAARKLTSGCDASRLRKARPKRSEEETRAKVKAAKADTVQALCENYLKRESHKLRTAYERERELKRLVYPVIGDVPLSTLKRSHIVAMLDKIEDENGPKMADLALAYVRKSLTGTRAASTTSSAPLCAGCRAMTQRPTRERAYSTMMKSEGYGQRLSRTKQCRGHSTRSLGSCY